MRKVRVQVFQIGDYVICSNKGVCEVENITVLNISGADKEKEYYILKPLYSAGSTVYVEVFGVHRRDLPARLDALLLALVYGLDELDQLLAVIGLHAVLVHLLGGYNI